MLAARWGLLAHDVYNASEIVGDLAEWWEVAEDGTRVTFHLHKGVKLHDGSDFRCADAQYSMAKLADRKRANPTCVAVLEEVYDFGNLSRSGAKAASACNVCAPISYAAFC
jgi:ABC-type transport system substrate-binding protein